MADYQKTEKPKTVLAGLAYYAFLHSPQKDEAYGDKYKIDLLIEDEDGKPFLYTNPTTGEVVNMVEKMQELGVDIKSSPQIPGRYVSIRSKSEFTDKVTKKTIKRNPIPTVFADKTPLSPETLVGNGSAVRVQALINEYGVGKAKSISLLLDKVIIDNLVPYVAKKGDQEFDFPHMRKTKTSNVEASTTPFDDEVPF